MGAEWFSIPIHDTQALVPRQRRLQGRIRGGNFTLTIKVPYLSAGISISPARVMIVMRSSGNERLSRGGPSMLLARTRLH